MSAVSENIVDSSGSVVPGVSPQIYSMGDFERIARMVHEEAGIVLTGRKAMLAYSRLAPLLRENGAQSFRDFLNRLDQSPSLKARTVAALTTNHTYFNREPHHYDHFEQEVLPRLRDRAAAGESIRLWSSACSSGEEVWTLMMVMLGEDRREGVRLASRDIVALGTDLAPHAVAAAERGTYPAEAMSAVPEPLRKAWCETNGDMLSLSDPIRKLVRFRQLNLLHSWPFAGLFDVIFCRNVMIYFDEPTKQQLVFRLAQQLKPGGFLYIGHSERVAGKATALLNNSGPTIYQRHRDAA